MNKLYAVYFFHIKSISISLQFINFTACPHGYFGLDCLHKCSTYCSGNGSCNPSTGVCNNGCKDGWSGSKCGTEKDAGMS